MNTEEADRITEQGLTLESLILILYTFFNYFSDKEIESEWKIIVLLFLVL